VGVDVLTLSRAKRQPPLHISSHCESIPTVKALLSRYGQEPRQREVLRVRMACLKCANGDFAALQRAVEAACCDYRAVLGPAEYPAYYKAHTPEAKRKAIDNDFKQLQSWLNRK
jgi:hypothetical protein